ncbi:hypothetical protein [Chelatococcus reniformis]|uniref:Uncharacterized protein n=1 Tax=Chelatococcus reniformis TaxID=1494448 RepID=A0A916X981_9HYPH|nr:hypothetical protein [Chelatococcus reniformis]GGC54048.1 hypothetical protein GCM10010994_11250 [Chelatococcus reniformis]
MRLLIASVAAFAATAVHAEGFAVRNLSAVATDVRTALGAGFSHRADARRVTLSCPGCKGHPVVDIQIGRQNDGTEQRVRSGQTPIARLEQLCRGKNPSCRLARLEVSPAVGWISSYAIGSTAASTAVVLRDGDLLTVRCLASDPGTARSYAERTVAAVSQKVIGP